ncbi:hypothetical protein [Janthinobacterium sp. ROICE36]|uniref:hypothetical protein n=1 Tax=Janthinobacterium sp. ROICE36 TaxID=2048670 RepID=UPI0011AFBD3C|nr:hypothetical protein [Janthinobacterium sp. ROICE36]
MHSDPFDESQNHSLFRAKKTVRQLFCMRTKNRHIVARLPCRATDHAACRAERSTGRIRSITIDADIIDPASMRLGGRFMRSAKNIQIIFTFFQKYPQVPDQHAVNLDKR